MSTLKLVAAGEMPVPPEVVRRVFARIRRVAKAEEEQDELTGREKEMLVSFCRGHVIQRYCGGQGGQAGDHQERPLQHPEQAGSWHEAGDRGLGRAERTVG